MTTPSKQARERCAELANAVAREVNNGSPYTEFDCRRVGLPLMAFARYVQDVSDEAKAAHSALLLGASGSLGRAIEVLNKLILPDPPDPLEAARDHLIMEVGETITFDQALEAIKHYGGRIVFDGD